MLWATAGVAGAEVASNRNLIPRLTRIRMRRRDFLHGLASTAVGFELLARSAGASAQTSAPTARSHESKTRGTKTTAPVSVEGYTLLLEFKAGADSWKVYEDLRTRDGSLVFVSSSGKTSVTGSNLVRRKLRPLTIYISGFALSWAR